MLLRDAVEKQMARSKMLSFAFVGSDGVFRSRCLLCTHVRMGRLTHVRWGRQALPSVFLFRRNVVHLLFSFWFLDVNQHAPWGFSVVYEFVEK